jgi:hypothetical protein
MTDKLMADQLKQWKELGGAALRRVGATARP